MTRSPLVRLLVATLLIVGFVAVGNVYAREDCRSDCGGGGCAIYAWGCDMCREVGGCGIEYINCDEIFCEEPCPLGDCIILIQ